MRKRKKTPTATRRKNRNNNNEGNNNNNNNLFVGETINIDRRDAIENFLRPYIVLLIVLPLSFVITSIYHFKRWWFKPKASDHEKRVSRVIKDMRNSSDSNSKICTNRDPKQSHSVRVQDKTNFKKVKMNDLQCILNLNIKKGTILIEPGVTVGEITKYLLKHNSMLECTLEMEEATLGGLAMATGMTTHSHVCGLIHDTIVAYDIVTAKGKLLHVTKSNQYKDLFDALPWSHGTLGLLVSLELRIVPSKPYVRLVYTSYHKQKDYINGYSEAVKSSSSVVVAEGDETKQPFFLETIVFSKNDAVLMEGYLSDGYENTNQKKKTTRNNIGSYYKPWFFKHVEKICNNNDNQQQEEEIIPIYDYLMRHDRSMCMTMAYVLPFGNHWLFRYTLGWLLPPNMSLLKGSHTEKTREQSARKQVYQDVGFPIHQLENMINKSHNMFNIYPLLCYPCKISNRPGFLDINRSGISNDNDESQLFLNLGIYGVPKAILDGKEFKTVLAVRELEQIIRDIGGFQHTYCDSFQTKEEFTKMFNHTLWAKCRLKYGGDKLFPTIYEKTHPNDIDISSWIEQEEKMIYFLSHKSI